MLPSDLAKQKRSKTLTPALHHKIYIAALLSVVIFFTHSRFLLTISQVILLLNWLVEGNFREKYLQLQKRPAILLFTSIYFVYLLSLIYSQDWNYAYTDLRMKQSWIYLALVIGTSVGLSVSEFRAILLWGAISLVVKTVVGIWHADFSDPAFDYNHLIQGISHIRFSLLLNLSIFSLVFLSFGSIQRKTSILYLSIALYLLVFLFFLRSYTGYIIFAVLLFYFLGIIRKDGIFPRKIAIVQITLGLLLISFLVYSFTRFYSIQDSLTDLPTQTEQGNPYTHDISLPIIENGHYVGLYICEKELEKSWNARSAVDYAGKDHTEQELRLTLIRYLTSKGYTKDSVGVHSLSYQDITNIENGMSNVLFQQKNNPYALFYVLIWQTDAYLKGGSPEGHSLTQRAEFARTAWQVFTENPWIGVGVGDVMHQLKEKYKQNKSPLSENYWFKPHNQYVLFLVSFGIIGTSWIIFVLIYSIRKENSHNNYFFSIFAIIVFLSMLNEDTLETQHGLVFFVFYYSLFSFGKVCDLFKLLTH